jgi:hypothetical protein
MLTPEQVQQHITQCQMAAHRAIEAHNLAMQAFGIACARRDWVLAETEHQAAMANLDAYLNALMSTYRLGQECER